jgi:predicted dinucleotide-binding enzyme
MKELSLFLHRKQSIISTVVSMKKTKGLFCYTPLTGKGRKYQGKSAAEVVQEMVGPIPVVSAFQTVPATYLNNIDSVMNIDVLVASNYAHTVALASKLIRDIPTLDRLMWVHWRTRGLLSR